MLQRSVSFLVLSTILGRVMAGPVQARAAPTVALDGATVTGVTSGSTNQFLGIPFAQPAYADLSKPTPQYLLPFIHLIFPLRNRTGNLRFQLPQTLPPYNTSFPATAHGPTCPQ